MAVAAGTLVHLLGRVTEGRGLCIDDDDRRAFLGAVGDELRAAGAEVLAWVLLPGQFQCVVRSDGAPLFPALRRALTFYAGRFQRRHRRRGILFGVRFRRRAVGGDAALAALLEELRALPAGVDARTAGAPWTGGDEGNPVPPAAPVGPVPPRAVADRDLALLAHRARERCAAPGGDAPGGPAPCHAEGVYLLAAVDGLGVPLHRAASSARMDRRAAAACLPTARRRRHASLHAAVLLAQRHEPCDPVRPPPESL